MQQPVKERIGELREDAQISEESRLLVRGGRRMPGAAAVQQWRMQRLEEILDELKSLTDRKKVRTRLRVRRSGSYAAAVFPTTFM